MSLSCSLSVLGSLIELYAFTSMVTEGLTGCLWHGVRAVQLELVCQRLANTSQLIQAELQAFDVRYAKTLPPF